MRLEQIEREAEEFNHEKEAYIHMEKATGTPYKLVMSGEYSTVMQGVFDILCHLSAQSETEFPVMLKQLKKAYKLNGLNQAQDL